MFVPHARRPYRCCVRTRSRLHIALLQKCLAGVDEVEGADGAVGCKVCRGGVQLLGQGALLAQHKALMVP